ncbi:MAG: tetratricopeptide repeat protein [Balneolaceae bacterium]
MKFFRQTILLFILTICVQSISWAQIGNEFQLADRLMRQQRYESALEILTDLVAKTPTEYYYFDRLIECYIQLKRYDEAIEKVQARAANTANSAQEHILEARIYHMQGDTSKAYQLFDNNLANYANQFQVYMNTGRALAELRAYKKAVTVFLSAREAFNNEQLFLNEVADAQMKDGNYEGAIKEWLSLIKLRPEQRTNVQRLLLRYNDPIVYDITIMELEDEMNALSVSSSLYKEFYHLQSWLLQENKLYRRALSNAIVFEDASTTTNYAVYNLGKKLLDAKEFELASKAYSYYLDKTNGEVKWRSLEGLADVYSQWAKQNEDLNIITELPSDSLYNRALNLLAQLRTDAPNYSRIGNVILKQAELALDFTYDFELAESAKNTLSSIGRYKNSAEVYYLEGRLNLINKAYTQARITFTKSNKIADIGALAEKTRYFLALTDFFAGDYEFASIQLKSLGRQNTSYYANNALELRLWIQKSSAEDSTKEFIKPFSEAVFNEISGNHDKATELYHAIIETDKSPYKEDALISLAGYKQIDYVSLTKSIDTILSHPSQISQRERLMWDRARVADLATQQPTYTGSEELDIITVEMVANYYEALLTEYPQSFYSSFARNRLSDLIKPNS